MRTATGPAELRPLTERVLAGLPGSRAVWIAAWALVPWLNAAANVLLDTGGTSAVWEESGVRVVSNYAALSAAVVITLVGTARIAHRLETLRAATAKVLEGVGREPFRGIDAVAGPLVATAGTALAFGITALVRDGWASALLRGTTWLVVGIALWTFLWTYASLQLGLDRLGREHLRADVAPVDPGLGLRPLGGVAFTALWMLLAWLIPVLLTGAPDVVGIVVGVGVLAAGLAAFFLSLLRLHWQMVDVKGRELAVARTLYAEAYEPVRATPTLESLERQRQLLGAADALEKRAREIHDWPIDDGTVARLITIVTSVIAVILARIILDPFGL